MGRRKQRHDAAGVVLTLKKRTEHKGLLDIEFSPEQTNELVPSSYQCLLDIDDALEAHEWDKVWDIIKENSTAVLVEERLKVIIQALDGTRRRSDTGLSNKNRLLAMINVLGAASQYGPDQVSAVMAADTKAEQKLDKFDFGHAIVEKYVPEVSQRRQRRMRWLWTAAVGLGAVNILLYMFNHGYLGGSGGGREVYG